MLSAGAIHQEVPSASHDGRSSHVLPWSGTRPQSPCRVACSRSVQVRLDNEVSASQPLGGKLIFSRKERWGEWLWLSTRRECFKEGGVISQSEAAGATSMASALAPGVHLIKGAVIGAGVGMKWLRSGGRHSPPSTSVAAKGRRKGVALFILCFHQG